MVGNQVAIAAGGPWTAGCASNALALTSGLSGSNGLTTAAASIRFHGVLAPHANLRAQIVPSVLISVAQPCAEHAQAAQPEAPGRMSWACLLKRVFAIDIERCPRCGGRLKIIPAIVDPQGLKPGGDALRRLVHGLEQKENCDVQVVRGVPAGLRFFLKSLACAYSAQGMEIQPARLAERATMVAPKR